MSDHMGWLSFSLSYGFLILITAVMAYCRVGRSGLIIKAGLRMTLQMMAAGYILAWIVEGCHPLAVAAVLLAMAAFAVHRVLSINQWMNRRFQWIAGTALSGSGAVVLLFYLYAVICQDFFDARYTIPLAGIFLGNAMTGLNLGLKTFHEQLQGRSGEIQVLQDFGAAPEGILMPLIQESMETAILPTVNTLLGMGIVFLPGMMSGQILAGISPERAVLYQMSVSMGLAAAVCLSVFAALCWGSRTLRDSRGNISFR